MRQSSFFIALLSLSFFMLAPAQAASPATTLTISPARATLTADQSETFTVKTTNADGTATDVTSAATWSTNDPLGSMAANVYHPGKTGQWHVLASYQSFNASANVTVTAGAVATIDINPNSNPEFTFVGKTKKFAATAFDQHNNTINDAVIAWSVIGEIGTIDQNGSFTAVNVGTGKIQAQSNLITSQVVVVVSQAPVINTNTTTNTNTAASTTNVNRATANTNVPTNTNTTAGAVTTLKASAPSASDNLQCRTLKSWLWIVLLIVFFGAVAILYGLAAITKVWPVVAALIGASVLTYLQRKYGCTLQPWWAWVMILGTVGMSLLAVRQSAPTKKVSE